MPHSKPLYTPGMLFAQGIRALSSEQASYSPSISERKKEGEGWTMASMFFYNEPSNHSQSRIQNHEDRLEQQRFLFVLNPQRRRASAAAAVESGFSWHMVRETGEEGEEREREGGREGGRRVVWTTAGGAPAHYHPSSIPRMHLVTCRVKMRTKYSCVQADDEKGRNARGDILATCAVTVTSRIHPVKCTAVARRGEQSGFDSLGKQGVS